MADILKVNSTLPLPEETIHISKEALAAAIEMQTLTPRYKGLSLRLYLEGKGCDGFYYGVTFDNRSTDDYVLIQGDIEVIIDPQALIFCRGASVIWVDDERGTGFLVENPQQWKFRGKFFKRKIWQEKLMPAHSESSAIPGPHN